MTRIGLIGDHDEQVTAHVAIPAALQLAAHAIGSTIDYEWLPTPSLEHDATWKLAQFQGLWAVPATPYESMDGALTAIRYAREQRIPFLGTCGGFQHMLIEFARNVLGLAEADHAESNPAAALLVVTPLSCSVSEQTNTFLMTPGSRAADIYGTTRTIEQYGTCNYGLNAEFVPVFQGSGMRVTGVDDDGQPRIAELDEHPFYMGTLFQPERSALKHAVHPLVKAFVSHAAARPASGNLL